MNDSKAMTVLMAAAGAKGLKDVEVTIKRVLLCKEVSTADATNVDAFLKDAVASDATYARDADSSSAERMDAEVMVVFNGVLF